MSKLKCRSTSNKIGSRPAVIPQCFSEQFPWVSFRFVTQNSNYNLGKLRTGTMRELTLLGLYSRLQELSKQSWIHWTQEPKRTGLETLSYSDLNFEADPMARLSQDTTIYVFRFDTYLGAKKGRIIGYKESPCSVFHIIGYDLDFSAYNHG